MEEAKSMPAAMCSLSNESLYVLAEMGHHDACKDPRHLRRFGNASPHPPPLVMCIANQSHGRAAGERAGASGECSWLP